MITSLDVKNFVEANPKLVKRKQVGDNMFLLKYTNKVFYDGTWNLILENCRGTIVDADYNIIQMPFRKIYNYGIEKQAPQLRDDVRVTAFRKVNGFMVAATIHKGKLLVSTTGSTDSIFVERAQEFFTKNLEMFLWDFANYTYLFECVHKDDPHIIPEVEGLYYIGRRRKGWNTEVDVADLSVLSLIPDTCKPLALRMTLGELKNRVKDCKHEGYVFYTGHGISSKLKSPYYLVKKLLARVPNIEKLDLANMNNLKGRVEEEYHTLIDNIVSNKYHFYSLSEQERLNYIREFLTCGVQ